jgi:molecular chaperone HtpG
MYENPFHCIREYVQNGFDAIRDAIREGQLPEGDGRILITIGGTQRRPTLSVRDNGIGIPSSKAFTTLISLGASRKTPSMHAGFRGIGRLAGIAYCTTLRFTTSAVGEATATVVEFDCGRIRSYFSPGAEPIDVREVVISSVRTYSAKAGELDHFTEVEMVHLVDQGLEFVEEELLQPYLRQVSPVDYPDTFEFADRIRKLAETFGESLSTVNVEIKQKRERKAILKPYKGVYPTGRKNSWSKIHNVELLLSKEHGWFGWIGISNFPGEIADDTAAGVRFRIKNIGVGDSDIIESVAAELTPSGTERRLQRWAIGEVFITNSQVIPNARRDGFEDNNAWETVRQDIKERVVKRITRFVRDESKTRNLIKSLGEELKRLSSAIKVTSISAVVKAELEREVQKNIATLGSPSKLVGADPKEVSDLATRFKDLLENLSNVQIIDQPVSDVGEPEKETSGSKTYGATGVDLLEKADGNGSKTTGEQHTQASLTRERVVRDVLLTELPLAQAERLALAIVARLAETGL